MGFNRSKWIYLAGFFVILALPLLNLPPWFSPPDWGKTIVFRIVLSTLIFIFLWQILNGGDPLSSIRFSGKVKIGLYLLLALFGIFLLATIFSLDRNFSLWGSPYRSGGFVNFAFYIIFAILAFLILRDRDWQKIWGFAILIGVLVSIVAIFQQFGIFSKIFIPGATKLSSTVGGPAFLGIYLLLLSFPALSLGLGEKNKKRILYFLSFSLFIYIIFLTGSQGAYLGFGLGLVWFIFFYPKKLFRLKIFFGILLILGLFFIYFLKTNQDVFSSQNFLLQALTSWKIDESRISSWKVSLKALKDRPIWGYGPENFSIGFDRYYDPSLPGIQKDPTATTYTSWWDRAHNFVFDISITAGIPAVITYFLLFGVLFWRLEKIKNKSPDKALATHGIQAAFVGYLAANFFNFDNFSTYLISFLLIGYSLHLINESIPEKTFSFNVKGESIITSIFFLGLVLFIWNFNIKPFQVNVKINKVKNLAENERCEEIIPILEEELQKRSYLDGYLRLKYVDFMGECEKSLSKKIDFHQKVSELLAEGTEIRPYYTRNWILLGGVTNILIAKEKNPEFREKLKQAANYYLEKASQLSPKRQEVYTEWANTSLLTGEYKKAKEKSQECIDLNPKLGYCWWLLTLSNIYLNEQDAAKENIAIASQKGYLINSEASLSQLVAAYSKSKNYQRLIEVYQGLIKIKPEEPQYHASLAYTYREIGQFEKAKIEAVMVLKLNPNLKEEVEAFLKTLP